MLRLSITILLAACSDYELHGDRKPSPPSEDTGTITLPDDTGDTGEPIGCELYVPDATLVNVLEECEPYDPGKVSDPWDLSMEWQFSSGGATVITPVTGNLTDDNSDGVIDEGDIPDVVMTAYNGGGRLYILSGEDGSVICTADGFRYDGGVVIADVDGDGVNEVVGPTTDSRVRAVDGDCNTEWTTTSGYSMLYPVTTAADLDGDGDIEVIADVAVVDGATGAPVATLAPANSCWRSPIVADLDLDGSQEIILGDTVFSASGARLWTAGVTGTSCFGAVADLDSDDEAEVIMSVGTTLRFFEHDGTLITQQSQTVSNPGPPCAGDIDGDGEVEVVAPSGNRLVAYEANGSPKWTATMQDNSGAAGCSVFDMNGDETYEVLFADEVALRLYDGATGSVLYQNTAHGSVTYFEYPTIADVDNDGSAEMIVANSSGAWSGITVFGHGGSGWPSAGPTWGVHDFAMTNQDSDGSIPTHPEPSWLAYNIFRGRPYDDTPGTPDLVVEIFDVCADNCADPIADVYISYQVSNRGYLDTDEPTTVALYMIEGGTPERYATRPVGLVPAGEALAGEVFTLPLADLSDEGFMLRIDDDGSGLGIINECMEDDNEDSWTDPACP